MLNEQSRALIVIEMLALYGGDSLFPGCDDSEKSNPYESWTKEELEKECKEAMELFWKIYEYAHVATNSCKNPHNDWKDAFLETEQKMINAMQIPHPSKVEVNTNFNWPTPTPRKENVC